MEVVVEEGERRVSRGKPFVSVFQEYCEKTILGERSVVLALRQVKAECEKIAELELCKTVRERREPSRFEQFQTEQVSFLQRSVNRLRNAWITSVREVVEGSLKKGQGWLTPSPEPSTYPASKLKRYFTVVKFLMEDALRATAKNSFTKLAAFISGFIPQRVEVVSIYEVNNYYADGTIVFAGNAAPGSTPAHAPLF
jgi:dynein heavy chain, axonemal